MAVEPRPRLFQAGGPVRTNGAPSKKAVRTVWRSGGTFPNRLALGTANRPCPNFWSRPSRTSRWASLTGLADHADSALVRNTWPGRNSGVAGRDTVLNIQEKQYGILSLFAMRKVGGPCQGRLRLLDGGSGSVSIVMASGENILGAEDLIASRLAVSHKCP